MGGVEYLDNEIPAGLKITMNIPSDGFSVGNLSTTSISGTVPYKNNTLSRNSVIKLWTVRNYGTQQEQRTLIFTWFLRDCTVYNNSSISFSGVDAMAFTNNNYAIGKDNMGRIDTVGTQVQTAATTISSLCGTTVSIDPSVYSTINNLRPAADSNKTSEGIKNLLQRIAKHDCVNYYTVCGVNSTTLTRTSTATISLVGTDYAPLTLGMSQNTISGVRVKNDKSVAFAPTLIQVHAGVDPSEADYGIFEFGNVGSRANTLEIDTPYVTNESPKTQFSGLLGVSFGTQFSCAKVPVPYNELFIPMARAIFDNNDNRSYYICSASYSLTSLGIYASISGTARSISDYDYVGTTEKELRGKLALEYNYNGTIMTQDGIQFVAKRDTTVIDSDSDITMGNDDIYGITPVGSGVFIMGNDIVCSSPLIGRDESHADDTPIHKITYEYQAYYIDVTWREDTPGVQTDTHWYRRWKT